jgi:hypothetical protein
MTVLGEQGFENLCLQNYNQSADKSFKEIASRPEAYFGTVERRIVQIQILRIWEDEPPPTDWNETREALQVHDFVHKGSRSTNNIINFEV